MKKIYTYVMIVLFLIPTIVLAYSNHILVGGQNIGINIQNNGILIVGFYKVNGKSVKSNPSLQIGDAILKVEEQEVNSIEELTKWIEQKMDNATIKLTILRNGKEMTSTLTLIEEDHIFKTGLYVKDSLTGIGTLTYIDPESKIYGALGHEIIEANTNSKVEVKTGKIFDSSVTSIHKSSDGTPGEKKATFNPSIVFGTITKNTEYGLFGKYTANLPETAMYEVAKKEEAQVGEAKILTVLKGNEIKEYTIQITKINEYNKIKNITFEITDQELLEKTGGVVQGMSGSPIIQNNKIIGAVTHVVVDNVKTGYGIFITTMLEEGEKE